MKLGLAEKEPPRPPTILVLGEGALASQIQDDLSELGLNSVCITDLDLTPEERVLPKLTDPDANLRFQTIFKAFRKLDSRYHYDHSWVHPGVTVWGERAEFEGWARQMGLSAITASAKVLHLFWNTHQLMKTAQQLGVPTLVLSDDPVTSTREIEASIKQLFDKNQATLPFVLKSAYRVRGGYASRVIRSLDDLHEWVPIWMNHIREASGASLLFIERYLESARCYVQPFARLKNGEVEFFPVIDASLIFEGKNWVEVCPAQNVDDYIQNKIEDNCRKILEHTDFVGVGNLLFLSNGNEVYLTEGLARPNFAYRLWETVGRTKALQWQLHALAPRLLVEHPKPRPKLQVANAVCGLNLKFYAEDTWLKIPHPGVIHELSQKTDFSDGPHEGSLIWDVAPGNHVDWKSSGALGLLTVFSTDWKQALSTSRSILKQIWISGGIQTNERFLTELLSHPWVEESMFYTGFVDEEFIPKQLPDPAWLQVLSNVLNEVAEPLNEKESWLWMNQRFPASTGRVHWTQRADFTANDLPGVKGFFQTEEGATDRICVYPLNRNRYVIRLQNWFFSVRRSEKGRPLQLMALTTGRVHGIFFREGSKVEPKQNVLIIESHQSLVSHRLPIPVKIKSLKVKAEDEVVIGQELAELERWSDN
jgi:biotin carboxylase